MDERGGGGGDEHTIKLPEYVTIHNAILIVRCRSTYVFVVFSMARVFPAETPPFNANSNLVCWLTADGSD